MLLQGRRHRWFTTLQNFEFEIRSVEGQIARVEEREDELNADQKKILCQCKRLTCEIRQSFNKRRPRELFIWQSLNLLQQNLLLIVSADQLSSKWWVLEARYKQINPTVVWMRSQAKRIAGGVPKLSEEPGKPDEALRLEMCAFRKVLDDRLIIDLWRTISLRRYSTFFCTAALATVGVLVAWVACEAASVSLSQSLRNVCCFDNVEPDSTHSVVATTLAGFPGGLLSSVLKMRWENEEKHPPLASVEIVRPVIGGIAGLFVYFVVGTGVVAVQYPALYAVALAFGFTERAFFKALRRLAANAESEVGKTFSSGRASKN